MRAVVQRVSRAQVAVNGEIAGQIGPGLLVLLGVGRDDSKADAAYLAEKIAGLRIFEDDQRKMNRSVLDARGSVLVVSQFTLYGDVRKGKRPSFDAAAPPEKARQIYEFFVEKIRASGLRCETGRTRGRSPFCRIRRRDFRRGLSLWRGVTLQNGSRC
jgi:D-tyrosyl-tRNA(Tyr) deacylase